VAADECPYGHPVAAARLKEVTKIRKERVIVGSKKLEQKITSREKEREKTPRKGSDQICIQGLLARTFPCYREFGIRKV
jgi:predicted molibdopterin-dependent oxidoreductase YjgC